MPAWIVLCTKGGGQTPAQVVGAVRVECYLDFTSRRLGVVREIGRWPRLPIVTRPEIRAMPNCRVILLLEDVLEIGQREGSSHASIQSTGVLGAKRKCRCARNALRPSAFAPVCALSALGLPLTVFS